MQQIQPVGVLCAAIISTTLMLTAPGMASENSFVFVPQADSPGNDYLRMDHSSLEQCARNCDAQNSCNAFTYNKLHGVCFLKRSANRSAALLKLVTTGISQARHFSSL